MKSRCERERDSHNVHCKCNLHGGRAERRHSQQGREMYCVFLGVRETESDTKRSQNRKGRPSLVIAMPPAILLFFYILLHAFSGPRARSRRRCERRRLPAFHNSVCNTLWETRCANTNTSFSLGCSRGRATTPVHIVPHTIHQHLLVSCFGPAESCLNASSPQEQIVRQGCSLERNPWHTAWGVGLGVKS